MRAFKSTLQADQPPTQDDAVCDAAAGTCGGDGAEDVGVRRRFLLYDVKVGEGFNLQREAVPQRSSALGHCRCSMRACGLLHGMSNRLGSDHVSLPPMLRPCAVCRSPPPSCSRPPMAPPAAGRQWNSAGRGPRAPPCGETCRQTSCSPSDILRARHVADIRMRVVLCGFVTLGSLRAVLTRRLHPSS